MQGLKNWKFTCMIFPARIAYACTQLMYVIVVFMNTHIRLNIFLSSLFTYFYKIILFLNLLIIYYILKHFHSCINDKSKVNTISTFTKTMRLVVRNYVGNLMFCRKESSGLLDYAATPRVATTYWKYWKYRDMLELCLKFIPYCEFWIVILEILNN